MMILSTMIDSGAVGREGNDADPLCSVRCDGLPRIEFAAVSGLQDVRPGGEDDDLWLNRRDRYAGDSAIKGIDGGPGCAAVRGSIDDGALRTTCWVGELYDRKEDLIVCRVDGQVPEPIRYACVRVERKSILELQTYRLPRCPAIERLVDPSGLALAGTAAKGAVDQVWVLPRDDNACRAASGKGPSLVAAGRAVELNGLTVIFISTIQVKQFCRDGLNHLYDPSSGLLFARSTVPQCDFYGLYVNKIIVTI